ncbi:ATP-binding protein [uncultured Clostridium sp.]|uniref:ATP-binding protein n=1 Tax=uncultured Clostridium sp. TaxID=59620 RepID=UPI0025FDCC23|nr:ATP-binding protein [uncultured Clostridium sp.]
MVYNKETNSYSKCNCAEKADVIQALNRTGLNEEGLKKTFKEFEPWNEKVRRMKDIATGFYLRFDSIKNSKSNSLALLGESGSGKTHLLVALINNFVMQKHVKVVYMSYIDSITELKQSVLDKETYQRKINRYKAAELLVIDDLFKGGYTDSDIRIMMEIVNHRYLNKLPFMISSEFFINDLLKIDKALAGRIAERTKDYIFEINGIDNNFRLNK